MEAEIEISSALKNNTFYVTLQESVKRFFHCIPKVLINFGLSVMSFYSKGTKKNGGKAKTFMDQFVFVIFDGCV